MHPIPTAPTPTAPLALPRLCTLLPTPPRLLREAGHHLAMLFLDEGVAERRQGQPRKADNSEKVSLETPELRPLLAIVTSSIPTLCQSVYLLGIPSLRRRRAAFSQETEPEDPNFIDRQYIGCAWSMIMSCYKDKLNLGYKANLHSALELLVFVQ